MTTLTTLIPRQRKSPVVAEPARPQRSLWWAAAGLYATLRVVNVIVLMLYADGRTWRELLLSWDAIWYASIADRGYDQAITVAADGTPELTNLAFFPLYPTLASTVHTLLSMDVGMALVVVSWSCGLAAAAVLYALGTHLRDRGTGILLAALWAVVPHGIVESMGYSESLFTALAAAALLAVLRRRWLTAGVWCLLAGLTRPTAAALIAAVAVAALVAVCRDPREWRAWCAMVVAPLGMAGYMVWVAARLDRPDGYFYVQNEVWKMGFDGGAYTTTTFSDLLLRKDAPLEMAEVSLVLLAAILLLVVAMGEKLPGPLLVYAAICVVIALSGDWFFWAKARMLIPAFPLLLPLAYAMRRSKNPTVAYAVTAGLAAFTTFMSVNLNLTWTHSF